MFWPILTAVLVVIAIADALGLLFWYTCSWPRSQLLGPALIRGRGKGKQIALTFDDGPLSPCTGQILDILKSFKVRATFFVCGKDVEQYPELVRQIHAEGHTIGNHTWSHSYLFFMSPEKIKEEIDRTQKAVHLATGQTPRLFRPPYGARWLGLYPLLKERGMHLVQWSLSGDDWKLGADAIARKVRSNLHPGAVILLHDGRQKPGGYLQSFRESDTDPVSQKDRSLDLPPTESNPMETVKALTAIINAAQAMEYELVSVEDFMPDMTEVEKRILKK